jgi:hypothetical protein
MTIDAPDEQTAIEYITKTLESFKAAIMLQTDMDFCSLEDPAKNERIICRLIKK